MRMQFSFPVFLGGFISCFSLFAAPTTLEESFRAATTKNESLLQSDEQFAQAEEQVSRLRGGILPNLSFNLNHMLQDAPADPVAAQFSPSNQTTMSLSVSQPLFRGLREWNGLGQMKHLRSAQAAQREDSYARLYRQLAQTYLQILSFEQDLKNLKDQADVYDSRVKDISGRTERGESNQSDLVTAQATQMALLAEIRLVEGQRQSAREAFQFLTGLDATSELVDPKLITTDKVEPVEKYLERIEQRPDIKSASERAAAADKSVSVALGAHFPTADLVGNYYLKRPGFLSDINWDVGLRLTVPLFEGGSTQAGYREAVSKRKEADLELAKMRRAARQEIRSLHSQLLSRLDQLNHLRRAADLSRKNTVLLQRDFRRGLARNIDVQLALTEFRVSQRTFDQAHFHAQLEMLQLQTASALAPIMKKESAS